MRRLTDLWSNLLSHSQRDSDATILYRDRMERADRIKESFANLYWTRIVAVDDHDEQHLERHPLADDIIQAHDDIDQLSDAISLGHHVYFDPK